MLAELMSITTRRAFTVLVALCACAATAGIARADDSAEACVKRGVELRRAGRDLEALEQFQRAYAMAPSPHVLAQLGLAEQALGRWPDAEAHVAGALAKPDAWVTKNRAALEESLQVIRPHLGSLEVLGSPEGAEVVVDGRVVGKLPLPQPVRVNAGTVAVEVRAHGYLTIARSLAVAAGELTRESVTLLAQPSRGEVMEGGPEPKPTPTLPPPPPPLRQLPPQPTEAPPPRSPLRTAAWVTAAGGAALALTGAAGLIVREVDATNYNNNCVNPSAPLDMGQQAQCHDWRSGGDTATKLATATLIAAGALGVASGVLFYVSATPRSTERGVALACLPDPTSFGIACAARF
jgi:hypothetical protein